MLILGSHIQTDKSLGFSLMAVFGINKHNANKICAMIGVQPNVKLQALRTSTVNKLTKVCRDHISANLARQTKQNIKNLIDMKHYKGVRHMFGHPSRGQRTHTNASTAKRLSIVKHLNPKTSKSRKQNQKRKN